MKLWKSGRQSGKYTPISEYYDPESPAATELRRLVRQLDAHEPRLGLILITSAIASEGKSLLTAHLGMVLAQQKPDETVIIIDADLRRPRQHQLFGIDSKPGVAETISGQTPVDVVLNHTSLPNLKIVPCGQRKSSPAELWQGNDLIEFLQALRGQAHTVLIDSPPMIPVTDGSLLAPHVDGVLMVALAGKTYREVIQRGLEVLEDAGANLIGLILNNVEKVLPYYYDYNYYGYNYKSESAEG